MADSSGSIANFDIVVSAPGAAQAQIDAVGALQAIGSQATTTAGQIDANTAATQRNFTAYQELSSQMNGLGAAQSSLASQNAALTAILDQLGGSTDALVASMGQMATAVLAAYGAWRDGEASLNDERLLQRAGIIQQTTADLYAQADAERAATEATVASMSAVSTQTNLYNDSRAIVLAHMQALEMDAAMAEENAAANGAAAAATGLHGLQLNRVVGELGTFEARTIGATGAIGRLTAIIGGNVVGFGTMLGIMLAIGGAEYIFEKLTGDTAAAAKAQEQLTKAAQDWYETQQLGSAAVQKDIDQIGAEQKAIDDLTKRLQTQRAIANTPAHATPAGGGLSIQYGAASSATMQKEQADLQQDQAIKAALLQKETDDIDKAANAKADAYFRDLAKLIAHDQATSAEYQFALGSLSAFQQQLADKSLPDSTRAQILARYDSLNSAILTSLREPLKGYEDQDAAIEKAVQTNVTEVESMAKVSEAYDIAYKDRQFSIAAIGQEGLSLAILTADHTSEVEAIKAFTELSGAALQMRLQTIDADRQAAIYKAELVDKMQAESDMEKQVASIGAQNIQITTQQTTAEADRIKAAQKEQDQLATIALQGTERILENGMQSWQKFFDDVLNMFQNMLKEMEKKGQTSGLGAEALQYATAGLAGGVTGYSVGSQTTNETLGALGGAAAGALTGAEIGSVAGGIGAAVGAVVGGLTGLIGGLLGSADKIKQLRNQLQQAEDQYIQHLQTYPSQYAATFAQITEAFQQLEDAAKKAHTSVSSAASAAEQQAVQQNATDFLDSLTQRLNALNGAAGSTQNQLLAAVTAFNNDEKTIAALGLGAQAAAEALQILNESIQQIADAAQAASDATTASLQERLLKDQGDTQGALEVQQAQELAQAIAQGMSPDQIQLLEQAQRIELLQEGQKEATQIQTNVLNEQLKTQQAALQTAQSNLSATQQALSSLTQFGSSLPIGSLSTLSPTDQLAAAKAQLQSTYNAALGGDTTAAGNFSGEANSFLQLSQKYNASGQGYVSDYTSVQDMLNTLTGKFGAQESLQQQMVDALQTQITAMQSQLDALNAINKSVQALKLTPSPGASPGPSNPGNNGPNGPGTGPGGNNSVSGVPPNWNGQYGPQSGQGWSGIGDYLYDMGDAYFLIDPYLKSAYTVPKSAWSNPFVDSEGNAFGMQQGWFMAGTFTVPPYAAGGDFGGGLRMVGEQGPELEVTGPSKIISNGDLTAAFASAGRSNDQIVARLDESIKQLQASVRVQSAAAQAQNDRLDKLNSSFTQLTKQTALNANVGRGRRA